MKRILVVGPIAEREIEATARWYEAREPGLGEGFIVELLRALDDIEERPESFPVLAGALPVRESLSRARAHTTQFGRS